MPPPVPPIADGAGKSTVDVAAEIYKQEPVGLGPRVPLIVVSPWTRGGFVNSELFDHTSIIRFLEARFGVMEPQISPWRRAMCGDLTSMFDFAQRDTSAVALPATQETIASVDQFCKLERPTLPQTQSLPQQENGQRPSRPMPYDVRVAGRCDGAAKTFAVDIVNAGSAGAVLTIYDRAGKLGPWYYALEAGKTVSDTLPIAEDGGFAFELHGPNGFFRQYRGHTQAPEIELLADYDSVVEALILRIANRGATPVAVATMANLYSQEAPRNLTIAAGAMLEDRWPIAASAHWYDVSVTLPGDARFLQRLAGHIETGSPSLSDPAFGMSVA